MFSDLDNLEDGMDIEIDDLEPTRLHTATEIDFSDSTYISQIHDNVSTPYDLNGFDETDWVITENTDFYQNISNTFDLEISGDPINELKYYDGQDHQYSCAIATTKMVLNSLGYEFSEQQLADIFQSQNVYDPLSGTNPHLIDETINKIAIATGSEFRAAELNNFTIDQLKECLNRGEKLLIGLDAYELDDNCELTLNEIYSRPDIGHAVQLTGIIETPEGTKIIMNDPGRPNGAGFTVSLDQFKAATDDFNNSAIRIA